jgi:uncharacterized protein (TIGR02001 family)
MRFLIAPAALATFLALPVVAWAENEVALATPIDPLAPDGFVVSGSLTLASSYVSDGIEYSDGPVIQPYIELGYSGFYVGVWATNAEEDLLGADSEVDYYIGYRGEVGAFYYDVGYGYYTYPGASEFNSGEYLVSAGVGVSETLFLTAGFDYSSEFEYLDSSLTVDYYSPLEGLALTATYGRISNGGWGYWDVGGSYAFNETFVAELTWNDTTIEELDGVVLLALTANFNLR